MVFHGRLKAREVEAAVGPTEKGRAKVPHFERIGQHSGFGSALTSPFRNSQTTPGRGRSFEPALEVSIILLEQHDMLRGMRLRGASRILQRSIQLSGRICQPPSILHGCGDDGLQYEPPDGR